MLFGGKILLTVMNWALWSDRTFIMGHVEDELGSVISRKTSIAMIETFRIVVAEFRLRDILYVLGNKTN
jgi:hypothetical protein